VRTIWRPRNGLPQSTALHVAAIDLMAASREDGRGNVVDATVFLFASMHCSAIRGGSLLALPATVYCGMERVRGEVRLWANN
jgi:hypothetical protein